MEEQKREMYKERENQYNDSDDGIYELGFHVKIGQSITVWLEGGRQLHGFLKRYDKQYQNMVIRLPDGTEAFIPRRFVVGIIKI